MTTPPPLPAQPVPKQKTKIKGCLIVVVLAFIGFFALGAFGLYVDKRDRENFLNNREEIISDIRNSIAQKDYDKAKEIAGQYSHYKDSEINRLLVEAEDNISQRSLQREKLANAAQDKINTEFMNYCLRQKYVTHIEHNFTNNFYVRLPAYKYTNQENVKSIAEWLASAYVWQNKKKGGNNTYAIVHVFKGDKVYARGSYKLPKQ